MSFYPVSNGTFHTYMLAQLSVIHVYSMYGVSVPVVCVYVKIPPLYDGTLSTFVSTFKVFRTIPLTSIHQATCIGGNKIMYMYAEHILYIYYTCC